MAQAFFFFFFTDMRGLGEKNLGKWIVQNFEIHAYSRMQASSQSISRHSDPLKNNTLLLSAFAPPPSPVLGTNLLVPYTLVRSPNWDAMIYYLL